MPLLCGRPANALFLGSVNAIAALAALGAEPLGVQPFRKHSSSLSGIQGFGRSKTKIMQKSLLDRGQVYFRHWDVLTP